MKSHPPPPSLIREREREGFFSLKKGILNKRQGRDSVQGRKKRKEKLIFAPRSPHTLRCTVCLPLPPDAEEGVRGSRGQREVILSLLWRLLIIGGGKGKGGRADEEDHHQSTTTSSSSSSFSSSCGRT